MLKQPYFSNGAARLVNNFPAKAWDKVFAVLYPEECFNGGGGGGDSDDESNDEEEMSDSEDEECEEDIDMEDN